MVLYTNCMINRMVFYTNRRRSRRTPDDACEAPCVSSNRYEHESETDVFGPLFQHLALIFQLPA